MALIEHACFTLRKNQRRRHDLASKPMKGCMRIFRIDTATNHGQNDFYRSDYVINTLKFHRDLHSEYTDNPV